MNKISLISEYAKENNLIFGIFVFVFLTFFLYTTVRLIYYFFGILEFLLGFIVIGDYYIYLGVIVGVICTTKYRKEEQSITKYNVIVVVIGGLISALFTVLIDTILYTLTIEYFFNYFVQRSLYGLVFGFFIAMILGARYMYKELKKEQKKEQKEEPYGDEFFQDLIDK